MWGQGGRFYWGRREPQHQGIAVVFAWLSSEERHLRPFVRLYSSLGWTSLVCHADFLTLFFPDKAASLAGGVLNELVKEVKIKPLPIVLVAFSGGLKGCMYKVLQLIEEKCEGQLDLKGEYQQVRNCVCGQIYDSSPVDFSSDLGTRFVLHPSLLKSHPPRVVSWMAKAFAYGLDTLFLSKFEAQRAEYWQTLYSSASIGPFLIFCSEDDELAPFSVVSSFAYRLQELGADVRLMKWSGSPHLGHYKNYPSEYKAAVTDLLGKAAATYLQRRQQLSEETMGTAYPHNKISESVCNLHKAAKSSNDSLRRVAIDPSDYFFLPSSMEYDETKDQGSTQNEQKGESFNKQNPPTINTHGVLSQILFDVCVPKNIEGWDIKPFAPGRGHGPYNPIKFIRRSRL